MSDAKVTVKIVPASGSVVEKTVTYPSGTAIGTILGDLGYPTNKKFNLTVNGSPATAATPLPEGPTIEAVEIVQTEKVRGS